MNSNKHDNNELLDSMFKKHLTLEKTSTYDTIDFIQQSLDNDLKRREKADEVESQMIISNKDASSNQNDRAAQQLSNNNKTQKSVDKTWNSGTIDFAKKMQNQQRGEQRSGKYLEKMKEIDWAQEQLAMSKKMIMEQQIISGSEVAQRREIGEYARFKDSEEVEEVKTRRYEKLGEMEEDNRNYIHNLTQMQQFAERQVENGLSAFEDEIKNEDCTSVDVSGRPQRPMESDIKKWKDTGLEEEIKQQKYQNPLERKNKKTNKNKVEEKKLPAYTTRIISGAPMNTSGLQSHVNIEPAAPSKNLTQKTTPLFQKTTPKEKGYYTLDGKINYDNQPSLTSSYTSISQNMRQYNQSQTLRDSMKNRMHLKSKFFILEKAQTLSSHISQNNHRQEGVDQGKNQSIFNQVPGQIAVKSTNELYDQQTLHFVGKANNKKKSQNLSVFGQQTQKTNESVIPVVKEWLESLDLEERVLAVTTVDLQVCENVKQMHQKHRKGPSLQHGKFRMQPSGSPFTTIQVFDKNTGKLTNASKGQEWQEPSKMISFIMKLVNSQAYKSTPEVLAAEENLLYHIRFTDTLEQHDTLTISEELMENPAKFYQMAETIVGSNYLKAPHDVEWIQEANNSYFESVAPLWMDMHNPHSLASWVLYFIERSLFIQYQQNIWGKFEGAKDQSKQPLFVNPAGRNISLKSELKPGWRQFCEENKEQQDELKMFKDSLIERIYQEFGIQKKSQGISNFTGGLDFSTDEIDQTQIILKIDSFWQQIRESVMNNSTQKSGVPVLNFKTLCMNTIKEISQPLPTRTGDSIVATDTTTKKLAGSEIARKFCAEAQMQRAPQTMPVNNHLTFQQNSWNNMVNMRLERLFVDQFRVYINTKLSRGLNSQNKKLLKKKLKKMKKKEQEKEKQMEEEQKKKQESEQNVITVKNNLAVQMLLGTAASEIKLEEKQDDIVDKKALEDQFTEIKNNKKKGKNKGSSNKPSTPKNDKLKEAVVPVISATSNQNIIVNPQNKNGYFNTIGSKYTVTSLNNTNSYKSSEIASTCEESKKHEKPVLDPRVFEIVMSNQEIIEIQKQEEAKEATSNHSSKAYANMGNVQLQNKVWQRRGYVNDLISENDDKISKEETRSGIRKHELSYLGVNVKKDGRLCVDFDDDGEQNNPEDEASSMSSRQSASKQIITYKNKRSSKCHQVRKSSSSSEESSSNSDQDLLPDLHMIEIKPEDNDSSEYGAEQVDEMSHETLSQSSVALQEVHQEEKSTKNSLHFAKKSIKSAHPKIAEAETSKPQNSPQKTQMKLTHKKHTQQRQIMINNRRRKKQMRSKPTIDFYNKQESPEEGKESTPEVEMIDQFKDKWKQLRPNPPLTIQYIAMSRVLESESARKPNKKTKKQKKLEWEQKYAQSNDFEIKQIEIIKPIVVPEKTQDSKKDNNKPKVKGPPQPQQQVAPNVDALNSFMKKIAGSEPVTQQSEPKMEKEKPEAEKSLLKQQKKSVQIQNKEEEKQKSTAAASQSSGAGGIIYQQKKKSTAHPSSTPPKVKANESAPKDTKASQMIPTISKTSSLNIQSKEFTKKDQKQPVVTIEEPISVKTVPSDQALGENLPETEEQKTPPKKKKKSTKKRSQKNKGKKAQLQQQQQQTWIDPSTGETMCMDQFGQPQIAPMEVAQTVPPQDIQSQIQQQLSQQPLDINRQVQDLLMQLNQQMFQQQQMQIADMQMRQQQEADTKMLEECEPCQEINWKYDGFFEDLEKEMKNKVREIDQLKDSVRKERQGFISIVESIVRDTFTNKYGNGFVGIKMFGSMATELAIETSDVDLVVTGISSSGGSHGHNQRNHILKMMQKLFDNLKFLKDKGQIFKMKFIQSATVPVVKLVVDLQVINQRQIERAIAEAKRDRESQKQAENSGDLPQLDLTEMGLEAKVIEQKMRFLKVDISIDEQSQQYLKFDNSNNLYGPVTHRTHSGIDTIYHIQELVVQRKDLRPIVMIIKKIFDETFLSIPYCGGISSFSLVLMVSAYLNRFDADKQESLSRNLSGFFHFYGVGFKPHQHYLSGDKIIFCEDASQRPFTDPFIVLDPLDISKNISHSTFRIKDIQRSLVQSFKIINESCEKYQLSSDDKSQEFHPKNVLERLMTEIRNNYSFSDNQVYDDDF